MAILLLRVFVNRINVLSRIDWKSVELTEDCSLGIFRAREKKHYECESEGLRDKSPCMQPSEVMVFLRPELQTL